MPNRRRRTVSTAMSTVAALAVATPFALAALADSGPQHREFVHAAVVTDLPNELLSALQTGLAQFGVNLPPLPTGLSPAGAQPVATGLATPGLVAAPVVAAPGLTTPGITAPPATIGTVTTPGVAIPPVSATPVTLTDPSLTNPALTDPSLAATAIAVPTSPGLTPVAIGLDPALTSPVGVSPGLTVPGEVPIAAPIGLDPGLGGTYPILGDPLLGATPVATGGGGLISDLTSVANQLGLGQAIDLLKGVVVPSITAAIRSASPAAAAGAPPVPASAVPPAPAPPTGT